MFFPLRRLLPCANQGAHLAQIKEHSYGGNVKNIKVTRSLYVIIIALWSYHKLTCGSIDSSRHCVGKTKLPKNSSCPVTFLETGDD